jgi:hypothetical protein
VSDGLVNPFGTVAEWFRVPNGHYRNRTGNLEPDANRDSGSEKGSRCGIPAKAAARFRIPPARSKPSDARQSSCKSVVIQCRTGLSGVGHWRSNADLPYHAAPSPARVSPGDEGSAASAALTGPGQIGTHGCPDPIRLPDPPRKEVRACSNLLLQRASRACVLSGSPQFSVSA